MNFITAMLVRNIREEEDCFWCLVYIMFEHNWREIFDEKSSKIAVLLNDLSNYIKKRHPKVFRHMELDEHVTFEASFSSQIITLFIYDAPFEVATRIFELFLLDGDRAIVAEWFPGVAPAVRIRRNGAGVRSEGSLEVDKTVIGLRPAGDGILGNVASHRLGEIIEGADLVTESV